jgi:hypothetical protein
MVQENFDNFFDLIGDDNAAFIKQLIISGYDRLSRF